MTHRVARSLLWLAAICLVSASAQVMAARVTTQPKNGYQRVNFAFDEPAQLKVDNHGNTIVLRFNKPLKQSADSIEGALGGVVKNASLSKDGKSLTLAMTKPYRTRHFVSGGGVGVDFITSEDDTPTKTTSNKPENLSPDEEILTTKKSAKAVVAEKEKKPTATTKKELAKKEEKKESIKL